LLLLSVILAAESVLKAVVAAAAAPPIMPMFPLPGAVDRKIGTALAVVHVVLRSTGVALQEEQLKHLSPLISDKSIE
jgi:hypothetical protein